jgi:hypothetical protein
MLSRPYAQILRITLPLLGVAALSATGVILVRPYVRYQGVLQDVSAWGAFFTVFGVVYAIVAGFLLITVLNRYSTLSQVIEDELNAVESIRDFLIYFHSYQNTDIRSLKHSLATYTKAIATVEWQQMSDPATPTNSDTSSELYDIMQKTADIKIQDNLDNSILSTIIACVADLAKLRTRRISLANERLPLRLRILLVLMSISLAAGFIIMGVQSLAVHIFMASTLSVSVYLLYWIIQDLDHPFYGVWNISLIPIEDLIKRFET